MNVNLNQKLKVLVVEDNEISRLLATSVLEQWGYESKVAVNGQQAIDILLVNDFDLVLMDIQMPLKDGLEATREIRKFSDERKKNIPIIALTANTAPDEASKCYEAGMNGFLNKPFIAADLQQLVGNTLAKTASNNLNTISASEEKHYNLSFIKELLGGDDSSLKPVIETFINSVPPLLESLITSYKKADWIQAAKDAHSLKSNIDALQISSIHDDVKNIDLYGKQNINTGLIPAMCENVKQVLELTIAELKRDFSL